VFLSDSSVYHKVRAHDAVGHASDIVVSDGVTVDTTPPEPEYLLHHGDNIVINPSFEDTNNDTVIEWSDIVKGTLPCQQAPPRHWHVTSPSDCVSTIHSDTHQAKDGRSFISLMGSVEQTLNNLTINGRYRISLCSSHLPLETATLANKEGYIEIGKQRHVFLMYTKASHSDVRIEIDDVLLWHHHTFYFIARQSVMKFTIGSMNRGTEIAVDHIKIQITTDTGSQSGSHVTAHTEFVYDWSSVHASWSFSDPESPIIDYMWAVGMYE
jgi:hypothetical protein